jgi:hypothetical protein
MAKLAFSDAEKCPNNDDDSALRQTFQDFRALARALVAGDLPGAQHAFAAFETDIGKLSAAGENPEVSDADAQADEDYQAMSNELAAGDLVGARRSFAEFLRDLQARGAARRSQRRRRAGSPDSVAA